MLVHISIPGRQLAAPITARRATQRAVMAAAQLPRRPLGQTGLEVSVLGFGASPFGGNYQDVDEGVCVQAVLEAHRQGINFFDTSPYYGNTKSETVLGKGLVQLPRDEIVVATKVGRYGADTFDFSAERVTASVRESLARLQTPYIDLIQTHDIEFTHLDQIVNETIPALQRLQAEGLVRHIGITGLPLKIFPYVLDRAAPGAVSTVLSYCHLTLNDKSLLKLVPYLQQKGVGIINASPLSMGLLTEQDPPEWHPAPPALRAAARRAAELCAARGVSLPKLAISDTVRAAGIATHLVGFTTPDQVRQNVATVQQALGLVPDPAAEAEAAALAEVEAAFAPVRGLTWRSGLPENN